MSQDEENSRPLGSEAESFSPPQIPNRQSPYNPQPKPPDKNVTSSMNSDVDETDICILGLPRSGKTTFLSVMDYALRRNTDWVLIPQSDTVELIQDLQNIVVGGSEFPPASRRSNIYSFKFERFYGNTTEYVNATMPDIRGVDTNPVRPLQDIYSQYVSKSWGVLFLVDSAVRPDKYKEYFVIFNSVFGRLGQIVDQLGTKDRPFPRKLHIAIALTKCDNFPIPEGIDKKPSKNDGEKPGPWKDPNGHLQDVLGQMAYSVVYGFEKHPKVNVSLDAISAVGYTKVDGKYVSQEMPSPDGSNPLIRDSANIVPVNVEKPLIRLLSGVWEEKKRQFESKGNNTRIDMIRHPFRRR